MPKIRVKTGLYLMAAGAAAAYFWDPDNGTARRTQLLDQVNAKANRAKRDAQQHLHHQQDRLGGVAAKATGKGHFTPEGDRTVKDQVDQVLGSLDVDTTSVTADVVDGRLVLRGQVASAEAQQEVEEQARGVQGVDDLSSFLHLPGAPAPNKAEAMSAS